MNYLLLVAAVSASGLQNILATAFNRINRNDSAASMYSILYTSTCALCWVVLWFFEPSFSWRVLPYSILFALCYAGSMIGFVGALASGSASITAFIKQLSLVGVAVWGFFFWNTPVTLTVVLGLVLIALALLFCLLHPHRQEESHAAVLTKKSEIIFSS